MPKIGQRKTKQREQVIEVFQQAKGPITVQDAYEAIQKGSGGIGKATVYRTVNLLVEENLLKPVVIENKTRYETSDLHHHHHFCCKQCNQVFDLDICPMHSHGEQETLAGGFVVERHEITYYGTCPACS